MEMVSVIEAGTRGRDTPHAAHMAIGPCSGQPPVDLSEKEVRPDPEGGFVIMGLMGRTMHGAFFP